ncbi:Uncharacterised protein [Serratia quinivorans]|nr:hypothetical protein Dp_00002 [Serratia proteamaculans]CAI1232384.1 Uncharacterised protein [Serratia quinivorans]CAI2020626.1 Uncharacterised protein [Serratia quinivorans]CAI2159870.1 Uncharacterised protein [Serratia quinivorans]CAI2538745.1 Uncharacterised protein [Serratia quinivorans]
MTQVIQPLRQGLPVAFQYGILLRQKQCRQGVGRPGIGRGLLPAHRHQGALVAAGCHFAGRVAQRQGCPVRIERNIGLFPQKVQGLDIPHPGFVQGVPIQKPEGRITAGNLQVEIRHKGGDFVVHRVVLGNGIRVNRVQRRVVPGGVLLQWTDVPGVVL